MKNIFKKTAFLIFAAASLLVMSCSESVAERENKALVQDGTAVLVFGNSGVSRTISPEVENDDFKKVTLTGSFAGGAAQNLGEWSSMSAFKSAKIEGVKIGNWSLTLRAETLANGTGAVYSATKAVEVKIGANQVAFQLSRNTWGTGPGSLEVEIKVPNTVVAAEVLVDNMEATSSLSSGKVSYSNEALSVGQHTITVKFFGDAGKTLFLNSMTEVVNIGAGLKTSWKPTEEIDVNKIYTIVYSGLNTEISISGSFSLSYTVKSNFSLPTPTKSTDDSKIWIFDGWYEDSGLTGSKVTKFEPGAMTGNKTFYPKFTEYTPPAKTKWVFTSWTDATKEDLAADSNWVKDSTSSGNKYKKTGTTNSVLTADGDVISETEGLRFKGSATIYWDSSKSYLQTGAEIVIPVVPNSTLKIVFAQTGSNKGARTFSITENSEEHREVGKPSETKNDKATATYTIGASTNFVTLKCYGKDATDTSPMFNFDSIEVIPPVYVESVAISGPEAVREGATAQLTATVSPSNATKKNVTWTSSNTSVATVDSNGAVTAISAGTTKITATSTWTLSGSPVVSDEYTVTVAAAIKPEGLTITCDGATSLAELGKGYTKTLTVSYSPNGVEDQFKGVTWTSDKPTIVSVTSNGESCSIKGLAVGTDITITATTTSTAVNPAVSATFTIAKVEDKGVVPINITSAAGWIESAYAEWAPYEGATGYKAYVKATSASSWTELDQPLIRSYAATAGGTTVDHYRVDAVGLKAGTYNIRLVAISGGEEIPGSEAISSNLTVTSHDRTGFAFGGAKGTPGAYNADGTLKANAIIVYVTPKTKNVVKKAIVINSKGGTQDGVGLQMILDLYKKGYDTRPLDIRLIGQITDLDYMLGGDIVVENGKGKGGPITFEGIGEDATADGWGLRLKGADYVEVRNIGFINCDSGEGDDLGLQQDNNYIWTHHNDMFYGHAGSDSDQAKGDGALDTKKSNFVTHSYNHFWDNGKSNLLGLSEGTESTASGALYITYHHNWYDHSDSRHPRVRFYNAHIYNNYYDGNAKYGAGSTLGSSLFMESNYFRSCQYPMMISLQGSDVYAGSTTKRDPTNNGTFSKENGGMIKAFNNYMTGNCTFIPYDADTILLKGDPNSNPGSINTAEDFDAYVVSSRSETVPNDITSYAGQKHYSNFDTGGTSQAMYSWTAQEPSAAKTTVEAYAGRMRKGAISTAAFYFDLNNYTPTIDKSHTATEPDKDYNVIRELKDQLMAYKGKMIASFDKSVLTGDDSEVEEEPEDPVDPDEPSLSISNSTKTLNIGETFDLTASLINGDDLTITWETANSSKVAITPNGQTCTIRAVAAGTVNVTVKAGSLSKTCAVTVVAPSLTLNSTSASLVIGATTTLTATLSGASGDVSWSTSNASIASVNASGVVTAVAKGNATITASAAGLTATCSVAVIDASDEPKTWLPGDTRSWLTGVTGNKVTGNRTVFGGMMKSTSTGYVSVARNATFTVNLPSGCTKITVYMASDDSSESELTAKIGSTVVGTYTMPKRDSTSTTPMIVTVAAGSTVDFTITGQKKGALCKVMIE